MFILYFVFDFCFLLFGRSALDDISVYLSPRTRLFGLFSLYGAFFASVFGQFCLIRGYI